MYCPDCGDYSTQGLNFCKQCGAALNSLDSGTEVEPRSRPSGFVWALALFTILIGFAGLAIIFGMSFVMAQNPTVDKDYPIALVAFGSLSFVGVLAVLVYMLLRLSGAGPGISKKSRSKPKRRRDAVAPPQIEARPATMSSVTEHTTRTFEPRMRESNALDHCELVPEIQIQGFETREGSTDLTRPGPHGSGLGPGAGGRGPGTDFEHAD